MKWEYKIVQISDIAKGSRSGSEFIFFLHKEMNELGTMGWELVAWPAQNEEKSLAVFKRQAVTAV